jgi:hypothetical protein
MAKAGPVIQGRASICTWKLEFYFRDKKQIKKFITLLMADEIDFAFEYEKVMDDFHELHYITVSSSFANNLVRVSKMAKKVDYSNGE